MKTNVLFLAALCALCLSSCAHTEETPDSVPQPAPSPAPVETQLSAQERAQQAYDQILGSVQTGLPFVDPYPDEFADAYYHEGTLVLCLTDISDTIQEKYRAMVSEPDILRFEQVDYCYNDLAAFQRAISKTEGLTWSSIGIDVKANRVEVGIPDISKEAESLALITEHLPSGLKSFAEYPIIFREEGPVQLD